MVRRFLRWFVEASKLPKRVITRDDGKPYLERWYLFGEPGGLKYFPEGQRDLRWWQRALTKLPCVYLHRFVSDDTDVELHNHPWEAVSLILAGGYREQRRISRDGKVFRIVEQYFRPWSLNYIFGDTFHKVALFEDDCWTVIKCGKKVSSWGFWSPSTGKFMHWRDHLARRSAK